MKKTGKEIIDIILNDLDIKAPTFAANIDVAYQRIYDIQREKTKNISAELANKIISKYSQYNISWIISGEGDIYNGTLTERLDKYRNFHGIGLGDFLHSIKMTEPRYMLVTSSSIRKNEIDAIYTNYPDLNPDWLITGDGNMLKNISDTTQVGEPQAPYGNSEDYITIPREVWDMLRSQMKQIEERNRQIDKIIDMLEAERNKNF